jgi:polyisoprenoid-binding protein YceI
MPIPFRFLCLAAGAALALAASAAPVGFKIDPEHTYPSLEFPHMGISVWRGKFTKTSGRVVLDRAARGGTVEVRVETASIDFGHPKMAEIAATDDWLDVAKYPAMTYKGALRFTEDTPTAVEGNLTLRGVTRPLTLKINSFKCIDHPFFKREVCGADAEGDLDRADYGMTLFTDDNMGKLHLRIQVEAMKEGLF